MNDWPDHHLDEVRDGFRRYMAEHPGGSEPKRNTELDAARGCFHGLLLGAALVGTLALLFIGGCRAAHAASFEVGAQDAQMTVLAPSPLAWNTAAGIGAKRVRTVALWGEWKRDGWAPYDRLVLRARARHWKVQVVLTGTPKYLPKLDQRLAYDHPNTRLLRWWAREWVLRYRRSVSRYSLWNEPNHPWFLASTNVRQYRRLYLAGRKGIRSVHFHHRWHPATMWGELAPEVFLSGWLVKRTPTACVALHLYTDGWPWRPDSSRWGRVTGLYYLDADRRMARRTMHAPVCASEVGLAASDPQQHAKLRAQIRWARKHGARQYIAYQMVRGALSSTGRRADWDTGLVKP